MCDAIETHSNSTRPRAGSRAASLVAKLVIGFACFACWLWCVGFAYCLDDNIPNWIAHGIALGIGFGVPVLYFRYRRSRPLVPLIGLATILTGLLIALWMTRPSHERNWGLTQSRLPNAVEFPTMFGGKNDVVLVSNIRSNRYGPVVAEGELYYNDSYDLSALKSVWFGVDRFTDLKPLAHSFLSFEFEPGAHRSNYLAFSVETRREKDELAYSPIRGLFRNYEIIYVISDEQDALSGRSDVRENVIQLYPIRATREQARAMFLDMLNRANEIREQPEFYHTLTNNCTNNIVYHTNKVLEKPIRSWERGVVFPGYSDWLAHRRGIIDTELTLEQARKQFRIDLRIKEFDGTSNFSEHIRHK